MLFFSTIFLQLSLETVLGGSVAAERTCLQPGDVGGRGGPAWGAASPGGCVASPRDVWGPENFRNSTAAIRQTGSCVFHTSTRRGAPGGPRAGLSGGPGLHLPCMKVSSPTTSSREAFRKATRNAADTSWMSTSAMISRLNSTTTLPLAMRVTSTRTPPASRCRTMVAGKEPRTFTETTCDRAARWQEAGACPQGAPPGDSDPQHGGQLWPQSGGPSRVPSPHQCLWVWVLRSPEEPRSPRAPLPVSLDETHYPCLAGGWGMEHHSRGTRDGFRICSSQLRAMEGAGCTSGHADPLSPTVSSRTILLLLILPRWMGSYTTGCGILS